MGEATARPDCYNPLSSSLGATSSLLLRQSLLYLFQSWGRREPRMDIAHEVKLVISKSLKIPVEQLTDETKLDDLGAESLQIIEMVFDLEEKFDIDIPIDPDAEKRSRIFSTIGDVARAVQNLIET
jgi:acyl carrier protein